MINTVRNTVLSVLNKNNYGYLSPSDFNLFAKQAQLDIFESYFYQYNRQLSKENARLSGSGVADLAKSIEEYLDLFSMVKGLNFSSDNNYFMPSLTTTGDDYYYVNKVLVYKTFITSGVTTAFTAPGNNILTDASASFTSAALGIVPGDIVAVQTAAQGVQYVTVVTVTDNNNITVTGTVLSAAGFGYTIIKAGTQQNEAEKVSPSKITMLLNSIYTSPSLTYPSYTSGEALLSIYPTSVGNVGMVTAQYYRYPKTPMWTYQTLSSGEPVFDQSLSDYQDFELPLDDESNLIMKILQYAGVSIREADVYKFTQDETLEENQQEA
jgi:hypothetical protein